MPLRLLLSTMGSVPSCPPSPPNPLLTPTGSVTCRLPSTAHDWEALLLSPDTENCGLPCGHEAHEKAIADPFLSLENHMTEVSYGTGQGYALEQTTLMRRHSRRFCLHPMDLKSPIHLSHYPPHAQGLGAVAPIITRGLAPSMPCCLHVTLRAHSDQTTPSAHFSYQEQQKTAGRAHSLPSLQPRS